VGRALELAALHLQLREGLDACEVCDGGRFCCLPISSVSSVVSMESCSLGDKVTRRCALFAQCFLLFGLLGRAIGGVHLDERKSLSTIYGRLLKDFPIIDRSSRNKKRKK